MDNFCHNFLYVNSYECNKQPNIIFDGREFSILFQTSPASFFLRISCQLFFPRVTFPMDALKINALNCSFFELKSTKTNKVSQKRKDRVTSGVSKSKIPPYREIIEKPLVYF